MALGRSRTWMAAQRLPLDASRNSEAKILANRGRTERGMCTIVCMGWMSGPS